MKKILENSYLLLIFFLVFLLKDFFIDLITIPKYKVDNCVYVKNIETNYNDLLEFNDIDIKYNLNYINSMIIYRDIYDYLNEFTIKGGSSNNLKKDLPVIYNNTLVGVISKTKKNSSIVRLLTNRDTKVSVKINDEIGILEYDHTMKITGISNYGKINIGDEIVTSGYGSIPENIFIGRVKDIIMNSNNIEKIIYVDYDIDYKTLKYVTILAEDIL